jgi:DNA-directed RNA polymerase beta subunit
MTNNGITIKYKIDKPNIKKGDIIFDYTGQTVDQHIPKIGYRTNVLFSSFFGFCADDAFVMSEAYSQKTRMPYFKKIFIPISKELKMFKNENGNYFYKEGELTDEIYSNYIKIDTSSSMLSEFSNTAKDISKVFGRVIDTLPSGKITRNKVHIVTKNTFEEENNLYLYTPNMIKEIEDIYNKQLETKEDIKTTLAKSIQDKADIFADNIFDHWESAPRLSAAQLDEIAMDYRIDRNNIDYIIEVDIYKSEHSCRGDKFANMYAGKGECSLVIPNELMPVDHKGRPFDIIFNPLGIFGRNNWGTLFELGLSKIIEDIQDNITSKFATKRRLIFINKFIKKTDIDYHNKIKQMIKSFDEIEGQYEIFKRDVQQNGLYLFFENFPGIPYHEFVKTLLLPYSEKFDVNITKKQPITFSKELIQHMRDKGFSCPVLGEDVSDIEQDVFYGHNYWMKLYHTSVSKYNAVSFANTYSKSTGEAPRGAKRKGGQHTSWQTYAGLEGHVSGSDIAKEFKTTKGDAVNDKKNFQRKMMSTGKYIMKDKYYSQTVNTLNNALNMLMMRFSSIEDANYDINTWEMGDEMFDDTPEASELFTIDGDEYDRIDNIGIVESDEENDEKIEDNKEEEKDTK